MEPDLNLFDFVLTLELILRIPFLGAASLFSNSETNISILMETDNSYKKSCHIEACFTLCWNVQAM